MGQMRHGPCDVRVKKQINLTRSKSSVSELQFRNNFLCKARRRPAKKLKDEREEKKKGRRKGAKRRKEENREVERLHKKRRRKREVPRKGPIVEQ